MSRGASGLSRLHLVPQIVVDDAQVGNRCRHPRRGWIRPRNAFACIGFLDMPSRFHTSRPTYSSLFRIPVPRAGLP